MKTHAYGRAAVAGFWGVAGRENDGVSGLARGFRARSSGGINLPCIPLLYPLDQADKYGAK